ncbi:hypothetical protein LJC52_03930 [Bacteroidales bacterium OttesenSCG-928-A17]|nr:hypothetical protein [Bacteroidales bacterium OttesenSCG-928-A17]
MKKKDDGEMKPASLFVFDIMGFLCFALVFFCLIISLGMINRKYLKSVRTAFSEVNASFIATKTQLATFEHRVNKVKDHSDELATIIGKVDFLDRKFRDYYSEEKELMRETQDLIKEVLIQPAQIMNSEQTHSNELTKEEIALLDEKLAQYNFSRRVLTVFETNKIFTFRELLKWFVGGKIQTILYFRQIGKKGRREILDILSKYNFIDPVPEDAPSNHIVTSKYSNYLKK